MTCKLTMSAEAMGNLNHGISPCPPTVRLIAVVCVAWEKKQQSARSLVRGGALVDEFDCLSRYSDAPPQVCQKLRFMANDEPGMEGAFKAPTLRNVALRSPCMHAGQLATLDEVVRHYVRSPTTAVGHSELALGGTGHAERRPIRLTEEQMRDVVAFLKTLSVPILERPSR